MTGAVLVMIAVVPVAGVVVCTVISLSNLASEGVGMGVEDGVELGGEHHVLVRLHFPGLMGRRIGM
jgi:hypothetical protein